MSFSPGTWKRIVPAVTRKVSSCISCQCAGGPCVRGGTMNSAVPIRLSLQPVRSVDELIHKEIIISFTRSRPVFHDANRYWAQCEGLARLCWHEIHRNIRNCWHGSSKERVNG